MQVVGTTKKQKDIDEALQFALGIRGRFIIAQALNYGIEELSKVPSPHKEFSNIADMCYLRETLFPFPEELFSMSKNIIESFKESD